MPSAFDAAPDEASVMLPTLLGDRRIREFRVEDLFELPLSEDELAWTYRPGPKDEPVAGGCFYRSEQRQATSLADPAGGVGWRKAEPSSELLLASG